MRILLVEDNRDILANLADYLGLKGYTVDCAQDGLSGLHLAATEHYDLIVLDIMLPGIDGYTLCKRLREDARRDTPVIMLTARDQLDDRLQGFRSGADDYLLKPFELDELVARLHALVRRAIGRSSDLVEHGSLSFSASSAEVRLHGVRVDLSRRELALLRALLQNPGRILSLEQLQASLYGFDTDVESNAVNVHIHHLRRKLGNGIVETVRGLGYRLGPAQLPQGCEP